MSDPKDRMPPIGSGSEANLMSEDAIQDRNLAVQGSPDGEDDEEMSDARLTETGLAAVDEDEDEDADMDEEDMEDEELDESDPADPSGSTRLTDETPPRGYR